MTVLHWLHAAAWWAAVGVLVAAGVLSLWIAVTVFEAISDEQGKRVPSWAPVFVVVLLALFVIGCPPAHSATLRWTAPATLTDGRPARSAQVHRIYYQPRLPRGGNPSLFAQSEWSELTAPWVIGEVDSVHPGDRLEWTVQDWWMSTGTIYVVASNAAGEGPGSNPVDVGPR